MEGRYQRLCHNLRVRPGLYLGYVYSILKVHLFYRQEIGFKYFFLLSIGVLLQKVWVTVLLSYHWS